MNKTRKIIENIVVYFFFFLTFIFVIAPTFVPQFQPYDYLTHEWEQRKKDNEREKEKTIQRILLEAELNSNRASIPMPCLQLGPNIIDCPNQKIECHRIGELVTCRNK